MSKNKIRFVIETISSERDFYGNCYHYSRIVSTKTGREIWFVSNGAGNARCLLRNRSDSQYLQGIGLNWDEFLEVEKTIPKRKHSAVSDTILNYESEITPSMIRSLERKNGAKITNWKE